MIREIHSVKIAMILKNSTRVLGKLWLKDRGERDLVCLREEAEMSKPTDRHQHLSALDWVCQNHYSLGFQLLG